MRQYTEQKNQMIQHMRRQQKHETIQFNIRQLKARPNKVRQDKIAQHMTIQENTRQDHIKHDKKRNNI